MAKIQNFRKIWFSHFYFVISCLQNGVLWLNNRTRKGSVAITITMRLPSNCRPGNTDRYAITAKPDGRRPLSSSRRILSGLSLHTNTRCHKMCTSQKTNWTCLVRIERDAVLDGSSQGHLVYIFQGVANGDAF